MIRHLIRHQLTALSALKASDQSCHLPACAPKIIFPLGVGLGKQALLDTRHGQHPLLGGVDAQRLRADEYFFPNRDGDDVCSCHLLADAAHESLPHTDAGVYAGIPAWYGLK
jgi:hypothetical protein